jgi:hypothetical protein
MHRSLEKLLGVNGLIKALGKPLMTEISRYLYKVKVARMKSTKRDRWINSGKIPFIS